MQAQVSIPNSSGFGSTTSNVGAVGAAGSWLSDIGASNCPGSLHNFVGNTAYGTGLYQATGMKMNANWLVDWNWANTNVSACPPASDQQPVPDTGFVFNDVCHL